MVKDSLLEEYRKYLEDPEKIPGDAYPQSLVNRVIYKYGSIEEAQELINTDEEKRTSLENKLNFVKRTDEMNINPDEILEKRIEKENLIREYGYPKLYAVYDESKGDFLSKSSNDQLGEFFKKTYHSVKEQLAK